MLRFQPAQFAREGLWRVKSHGRAWTGDPVDMDMPHEPASDTG